ncbi:MAG: DNA-binding CsgD family transcriptional regulator/GAF domain-containing protein [Halioglobus sp.]
MISVELESLIGLIYEGALETQPWQSALPALREALDAQVASLILRPPTDGDKGVILNSLRPRSSRDAEERAKPDDWQLTIYREEFFALDPFLNLPPGQVISLEDILPDEELKASDYYLHYLEPIGLFRILGVDTLEPGGMLARLRFSRRAGEPRFSEDDREILKVIAPHLQRAIQIYAKLNRTTSERDLFAGAVDQLSVATIILDEQAQVANTNAIAEAMLSEGDGISLQSKRLQISGRDTNNRLQSALTAVIKAQKNPETSVVRAFSVPRSGSRSNLGLVIRPIPSSHWSGGQSSPCAAVFISDPDLQDGASQQALGELLGLTPAEANLAILLARGHSLAQVSELQSISQHTARAQLKSIFSKTGASRQAELVRLVLKSVATLA